MKGLLFTPEMARAVCLERKTQTRRVVPGKLKQYEEGWSLNGKAPRTCPGDWCLYQPEELVCLLTTWAVASQFDDKKPTDLSPRIAPVRFWHAGMGIPKPVWAGKSRPGRFLPNHLRHMMPTLRITDVDVRRVQQISEADSEAEGIFGIKGTEPTVTIWRDYSKTIPTVSLFTARDSFRTLWNSINAERGKSWGRNPQVFVITFHVDLPF